MSKAFTSGDDAPQNPLGTMPSGRRPITRAGWLSVQQELRRLQADVRPAWLAGAADGDPEARARLRTIDWRIEYLTRQIALSDPVPEPAETPERAGLGTRVRVRDEGGAEHTYALVGPDEIDMGAHRVSHASPVGRALLGRAVGDWATISRPAGDREIEVVAIERL